MFEYVGDASGRVCPRRTGWSKRPRPKALLAVLVATIGCQNQLAAPTSTGARPTPLVEVFNGCPGEGTGPDPQLNRLKNRVDEAVWQPTTVAAMLQFTWPTGVAGKRMSAWAPNDRAQIEPNNGNPVQA